MSIKTEKLPNLVLWSNTEEGDALCIEGSVESIFGYSGEELVQEEKDFTDLVHPDDREYLKAAIARLKNRNEGSINVQYRVIRKDSQIRNVLGAITKYQEEGGSKFSGYLVDVTRRNQDLKVTTHRKNLLNLLGDSIATSFDFEKARKDRVQEVLGRLGEITKADRVYIFDKKAGDNQRPILNQNYEWCREGVESQMDNDVVFDVDLKELVPRWYKVLVEEKGGVSGIVRYLPEEEREVLEPQDIVSILVTPIWYDSEFFGFIGFDDCSEERVWNEEEIDLLTVFGSLLIASWKYEDSIGIIEDQLDELKKMQLEREQFLKMVSHQFKTPLSVIKLNTDLLRQICNNMASDNTNKVDAKISRIERSIDKFEDLIEAILIGNANHSVDHNPEALELHEWLEQFAHTKKHDFKEIGKLELHYEEEPAGTIMLPFSLKTFDYMMDTFLSNAIKYRGEEDAQIDINYQVTNNSELQLSVKDEGIGINAEDLDKVANPFFRANNVVNTSGTGIGLSMVKDAIHSVGGQFEIQSELGAYTQVTIIIPINNNRYGNE